MDIGFSGRPVGTALVGVGDAGWGRVVLANQALADLLGQELESVIGGPLDVHLHADDRPRLHDALTRLTIDPAGAYEGEWRLLDADGGVRAVTAYASTIDTAGGPAVLIRMALARFSCGCR